MQRGFAQPLLVLLGLIILAAVGVYFYQASKVNAPLQAPRPALSKQSKLISYKNTDLGFGFDYSKDVSVKEDSEEEFNQRAAGSASKSVNGDYRKNFKGYVGYEPGKVLGAIAVLDESSSYDKNPFSVWIFDNDRNLTADQWFQNYWYYPFLWGVFDFTSKGHIALDSEATVSGQVANYKIVNYQPGKPKFVYISRDQKMYLFRVIGEGGDKILSSFDFLK